MIGVFNIVGKTEKRNFQQQKNFRAIILEERLVEKEQNFIIDLWTVLNPKGQEEGVMKHYLTEALLILMNTQNSLDESESQFRMLLESEFSLLDIDEVTHSSKAETTLMISSFEKRKGLEIEVIKRMREFLYEKDISKVVNQRNIQRK